jgi:hypothetical protein
MALQAGNVFLSSYNCQENETNSNFTIILAVPVTGAKRIRMLSASVPHLMMPFANNDKLFQFILNGTTYSMNFPTDIRWFQMGPGPGTFLTAFNALLAAIPGLPSTLTVTYNQFTNKLTITSSNPADTITIPPWNFNNPPSNNVSFNAHYRLGFTNTQNLTGVGSVTALGFPNVFVRTNIIYVQTNIVSDSNNDANVANILGRIPVDVSWGALINYENVHSDFVSPVFSENIKEISIRLLDEDYQQIVLPDNAYFNLCLGVEYT